MDVGQRLHLPHGPGAGQQQALIAQLEAARSALADQAVAEERRRIARELHDLAGHTLAAVLLHVTGARHVLRRDLDEAERALLDAETVGRASLDQIRATVAALRTHERGTDPPLAGGADLAGLVDEYRRAGLRHRRPHRPRGRRPGGPDGDGGAPHRPRGPGQRGPPRRQQRGDLTVTVEDETQRSGEGAVQLVVRDRGRAATPPDPDAGHFGLVGMRERARALGGELEAGPTADGWLVGCPPAAGRRRTRRDRAPVIRVVIVDDQPVVRVGVARILGPDDGFEVVAECDDGDEVVAAVAAHRPDVVLMDVRMRRMDGVTATR